MRRRSWRSTWRRRRVLSAGLPIPSRSTRRIRCPDLPDHCAGGRRAGEGQVSDAGARQRRQPRARRVLMTMAARVPSRVHGRAACSGARAHAGRIDDRARRRGDPRRDRAAEPRQRARRTAPAGGRQRPRHFTSRRAKRGDQAQGSRRGCATGPWRLDVGMARRSGGHRGAVRPADRRGCGSRWRSRRRASCRSATDDLPVQA